MEQEGAQEGKAPAVASKKRQGGIGSLAAVTGKKGRAACEEAVPAARAEGPMYGGSYDLGRVYYRACTKVNASCDGMGGFSC